MHGIANRTVKLTSNMTCKCVRGTTGDFLDQCGGELKHRHQGFCLCFGRIKITLLTIQYFLLHVCPPWQLGILFSWDSTLVSAAVTTS